MGLKVYLDAGHNNSGFDTGAYGNGLREQDMTYYIAQKVGARLQNAGVTVKYSRTNITDNIGTNLNDSLNKRCQMANLWGADYFVSIHCNAGGGTGIETYCLSRGGNGEKLAKTVQDKLVGATGLFNRGVKTGNLYVLRYTNMPAILTECGFIDNKIDSAMLATDEGRNKFADGIVKGLLNFMGMAEKKVSQEYVTASEAIGILVEKGIISEPAKWYEGTWNDDDFKWLLRKIGTYLK